MKKIILILLIAWILLILLNKTTENFDIKNTYNDKVNCCLVEKKFVPINNVSPPKPFNKASFDLMPNKDLLDYAATHGENYMNHGEFAYTYNKLTDDACIASKYELDSNKILLIDGKNNWSNEMCTLETLGSFPRTFIGGADELRWEKQSSAFPRSNQTSNLGSCRRANKECVDFVDKQFCDKYINDGMTWSDKPCNMPLDFKFIHKIKLGPTKVSNDKVTLVKAKPNMIK